MLTSVSNAERAGVRGSAGSEAAASDDRSACAAAGAEADRAARLDGYNISAIAGMTGHRRQVSAITKGLQNSSDDEWAEARVSS
jgi:hypothetical protein